MSIGGLYRGPRTQAALLGAIVLFAPSVLFAQSVTALSSQADELSVSVDELNRGLVRPELERHEVDPGRRAAEGEVLFLVGDYEGAATSLAELVESREHAAHPAMPRARYILAESLYQVGAYSIAADYFETVLAGPEVDYQRDAAVRLLEIALKLRRYEEVDQRYGQMLARFGDDLGDRLAYLQGRARHLSGDYNAAVTAFRTVPANSDLYVQSRYLAGIALVQLDDLENAMAEFAAASELSAEAMPGTPEHDVHQLAQLAIGRLNYESSAFTPAVLAYAQVDSQSDHFFDAIYEMSWTLIREERFTDAIYNLELLYLLSEGAHSRYRAEAGLVVGDLYRRNERFDDAVRSFGDVVEEFEPTRARIDDLLRGGHSVLEIYNALVGHDDTLRTGLRVSDWVEETPEMTRAMGVIRDAARLEGWVESARDTVNALDAALNSRSRVDIFPELRNAWAHLVGAQGTSLQIRSDLLEVERERSYATLPPAEQTRLGELRALSTAAWTEFGNTPNSFDELLEVETQRGDEIQAMILDVYRTELQLEGELREVQSMRDMLRERVRRGETSRDVALQAEAELIAEEERIHSAMRERRELRERLEVRAATTGVGGISADSERAAQEVLFAFAQEHDLIAGAGATYDDLNDVYAKLDDIDRRIGISFSAIDSLVQDVLLGFHQVLADESRRLEAYEAVLRRYERSGATVAGSIAMDSFRQVRDRVAEITLRANLGMIDIKWWEKESVTRRISDLFEEKDRQLRILDADFAEIRLSDD